MRTHGLKVYVAIDVWDVPVLRNDAITMDYGCYRRDTWKYNEPDDCDVNLTVTYSLGSGNSL
jgi:hypothetical protein